MLNALVLTRGQMKKYGDITGYYDKKYYQLYGGTPESFKSEVESFSYGREALKQQCDKLKANACSSFAYTSGGFTVEFDNKSGKDTLLFFTVPYSDGFSAEVNGVKTDVEKATFGFMAVKVPAGKSTVVFTYRTPGFSAGVLISLCALGAYVIYMALTVLFRVRQKKNFNHPSVK